MTKPVVIVELNEFNTELLFQATKQHSLPALAKVLSFKQSNYKTNDRYNSGYLEPWVQWVSIHAGTPSTQHQIKHLGDVPDLAFEQCWETLSNHDVSVGVWGVMNGARNKAKNVPFFLPDPWTFSEKGQPSELNHLLDLPRYISKNYQNLKVWQLIKKGAGLINFILASKARFKILAHTLRLVKHLQQFGKKHFVYISYFDYISTMLFCTYKRKFNPNCSIIFLNSLAHLQHHHWKKGPLTLTPPLVHGLKTIDAIFAYLFEQFPDNHFVVHNGLSQMNTNHEKAWVLYRQKDPMQFLKSLQIPAIAVEQHMTHDGHVFFANAQDCQNAYQALKEATIEGKNLFHVEFNQLDNCKLFYMLKFTDELKATDTTFSFNQKNYKFFEHFDSIVTRTGRHIPFGTVFSDAIHFPDQIYNHDFNRYVYHYFKPEAFPLPQLEETSLEEIDALEEIC